MSTVVLTNAFCSVNGVDLSDHVKSITLNYGADNPEDTAMGATFHTSKPGLKKFSAVVEFYQDHASSKTNETIYPLIGSSTLFAAVFKADSAVGTNNTYTLANAMVGADYNPIKGSVGDILMAPLTLVPGSGFTLTKS